VRPLNSVDAVGDAFRADGVQQASMTDAMLVQRALDGDSSAFTQLIDRHSTACLRFAQRMLGNREDAEDASQEAFLRAYRGLGQYEERQQFRTWLFQILVNRCRTLAGRNHRRSQLILIDSETVERSPATVSPATPGYSGPVQRALASLDATQREAFLLKHVEELSYEEMAAVTGVRISALKMRVKRAGDRLRAALEDGHHD
jgi:RNA polymerase sigma-70 factor (ECF subfamily)